MSADGITCSDVRYENHQGVPGLCYQLGGDTNWTHVKPDVKAKRQETGDRTPPFSRSRARSPVISIRSWMLLRLEVSSIK